MGEPLLLRLLHSLQTTERKIHQVQWSPIGAARRPVDSDVPGEAMKSPLHDHADGPPVIASQLVYFFVPLPDPLGLPDRYVVEVPEHAPLDRIRDDRVPPICLGASLCFHTVELPTTYAADSTVLFDLAAKSLRRAADTRISISEPGSLAGEPGWSVSRTPIRRRSAHRWPAAPAPGW